MKIGDLVYLIPGFISYVLLRPFGMFNFKNETDRQVTLLILSVINAVISTVISDYTFKNSIFALLCSSVMITIVFIGIFIIIQKTTVAVTDKLNMNLYDDKETIVKVLSRNYKDKKQFIISFDFNDEYIASGFVRNVDDQGNQQIELYGNGEDEFTIEQAREWYEGSHLNSLVIDYKNKSKTYVILHPNESGFRSIGSRVWRRLRDWLTK